EEQRADRHIGARLLDERFQLGDPGLTATEVRVERPDRAHRPLLGDEVRLGDLGVAERLEAPPDDAYRLLLVPEDEVVVDAPDAEEDDGEDADGNGGHFL